MLKYLLTIAFIAAGFGGSAPVYLSPATLVPSPDGKQLYVAEFTASQIAVFDVASQTVRKVIPIPDRPSGMALSDDGGVLYVTGGVATGKVYAVDTRTGGIVSSIAVGHTPGAPVLSKDGKTLYVCNRFNNDVSVIPLDRKTESVRIAVSREPIAAVLSGDGKHLFVANQLPTGPSTASDVAAEISVIDTATNRLAKSIRLPDGGSGVRGLCLSPDGQYVYVTHLLARYQLPASQIERGWIQTNALSVIKADTLKLVNSILLDDINLGAANPWGVACTKDGKHLCVAHAGTHEISVIDRVALHKKLDAVIQGGKVSDVSSAASEVLNDMAFLAGIRTRVALKGNGPRGLAVVGSTVYAAEYFTDSLGVLDLNSGGVLEAKSVKLGKSLPLTAERRGEMLFHDGQYAVQKWLSCSSCHTSDARPDGFNWDLMLDGVGNGKNTKSLMFAHQTPPTTWTGTRPNAEASVRAGYRSIEFAERPEEDCASIDAFLKSLQPVPSPYKATARGKKVFESAGCTACHSGRLYTDLQQYDVGTGAGREKGTAFDTPTLIEVWRTAPYLHDGRSASIRDVLSGPESGHVHNVSSKLRAEELDDLVAFVLSL